MGACPQGNIIWKTNKLIISLPILIYELFYFFGYIIEGGKLLLKVHSVVVLLHFLNLIWAEKLQIFLSTLHFVLIGHPLKLIGFQVIH